MFSGTTPNGAVQLFKDVSAALPDARLYGPDGVSNPEFFVADEGGIPADVADKVKVTVATRPPEEYPPDGQRFFDEYKERYDVPCGRSLRDLRRPGDAARPRHLRAARCWLQPTVRP